MSSGCFEGQLVLRALDVPHGSGQRQRYALVESLHYRSNLLGGQLIGAAITVPAAFQSDFASIPTFVQVYLDDDDPVVLRPSVVHDWVYACNGRLPDGRRLTRRTADRLLIEGMHSLGARWDQRVTVWCAVRLCGWWSWSRHAARNRGLTTRA